MILDREDETELPKVLLMWHSYSLTHLATASQKQEMREVDLTATISLNGAR
jgi:hypothetical protein